MTSKFLLFETHLNKSPSAYDKIRCSEDTLILSYNHLFGSNPSPVDRPRADGGVKYRLEEDPGQHLPAEAKPAQPIQNQVMVYDVPVTTLMYVCLNAVLGGEFPRSHKNIFLNALYSTEKSSATEIAE